ncbi:MAG TPA: epoxide hydrolase [Hyphomicrobiaceae bacterium]|nr:epoxide hydrolase [Hyphomicrobiaceae bacterium]
MYAISLSPTVRRLFAAAAGIASLLVATAAAGDARSSADAAHTGAAKAGDIRPFRVTIPEEDLNDLRRRIAATRWPDRETVQDQSQGIQLAKLQELVRHWGTAYDWRKAEAKLNSLPQFVTNIDGLDVHFIHVQSQHTSALPVIMTHGWPGSVFELVKVIGPLTDPTAHGGTAQDAFDLVFPSMPGYGFSGKPQDTGWGPDRIARTWAELMRRLGYSRYVAQGGDWGSPVSSAMARLAPAGLIGIHINLPATVPAEIIKIVNDGGPAPAGLSDKERAAFDALSASAKQGSRSYATMMGTRPQTIGYGLTDSPAGLAAWMLGHPGFSQWTYSSNDPEKSPDEVLDDVTLYWLTNTATSAARLYWEYGGRSVTNAVTEKTNEIALPVAITVFPGETYRAPETWARRAYPNLIYFREVDRGGHFAAWEQPQLFASELRAAFRPLR